MVVDDKKIILSKHLATSGEMVEISVADGSVQKIPFGENWRLQQSLLEANDSPTRFFPPKPISGVVISSIRSAGQESDFRPGNMS